MNRKRFLTQTLLLACALLAVSWPAGVQGKQAAGILRILEVSKRDVPDAPAGQMKQVPVTVKVAWERLIEQAKLVEVTAEFVTLNSDGTQTRVTQKYDGALREYLLTVPLANGVFAKSYRLNAIGSVLLDNGKRESVNASKSGSF